MTTTDWTTETKGTGAYADVNGINLYYETHGSGRPLILLHGGLGSGEMFGPTLPGRWPPPPGHRSSTSRATAAPPTSTGRSTSGSMADDIAALIDHLGLEQAGPRGLLARRRRRVPDRGRSTRSKVRQAGDGLGQHPAQTRSTRRCSPSRAR